MLSVYVFSLVLGGGFLIVSLFGGEGGDVDMDVDVDLDFDAGADGLEGAEGGDHTAASKIFSVRTLVYGLFGFGATGTALTLLGSGFATTLMVALVGGVLTGALVGTLFRFLTSTASGDVMRDRDLVGLTAAVVLPLSRDAPGMVAVERGGQRSTLRALPHRASDGEPDAWKAVVIVEVEGGVVRVAPLDQDEADLLPSAGSDP